MARQLAPLMFSRVLRLLVRYPQIRKQVTSRSISKGSFCSAGRLRLIKNETGHIFWPVELQQGKRNFWGRRIEKGDEVFKASTRKEGLECNITYPEINPTDCDNNFSLIYEGNKRPVVVVLGWTGSQDKNVAKYSNLYEKSCITMRCTIPGTYFLSRRSRISDASREVLQVISEKGLDDHPIFFVVLSNGGAVFYQQISIAMQKAGSPLKVKGVIFDSSPSVIRFLGAYEAAKVVLIGRTFGLLLNVLYTMYYIFQTLLQNIASWFGAKIVPMNPIDLVKEPNLWPQLILYSDIDLIVYARDVEAFANERLKWGGQIHMVFFLNVHHLKIRFKYRDAYISNVCDFMNQCLAEQKGEAVDPHLIKRIVPPQKTSVHIP